MISRDAMHDGIGSNPVPQGAARKDWNTSLGPEPPFPTALHHEIRPGA